MINISANEAVKFNNGYLVNLPTLWSGHYLVGQDVVERTGKFFVESVDNIFKVETSPRYLVGYKDPETSELVTVQELYKERHELSEDGEYPDIDTHYRVEKRIQRIEAGEKVWQEAEEKVSPVAIKVIGTLEDTGSPFIETAISVGQTTYRGDGMYKVFTGHVAKDEWMNLSKASEGHTFEHSSTSHLKFAKVNGQSVFYNSGLVFVENQGYVAFTDSLEKARKIEEEVRETIRRLVNVVTRSRPLDPVETSEILKDVQAIRRTVLELQVKVASNSSRRIAINKLNDLIKKIEDLTS